MAKLKDILAAFLCTVGDSGDVSSIFGYVNGLHLLAYSLNANSNILNEHSRGAVSLSWSSVSHVLRLCNGPRFDSWPGSL